MADIVVTGAGIVGLCTAMLLAEDGHDVTVLERDAAPVPDPGDAWDAWARRGVNQFRLPHFLQPRFRDEMATHLPGVEDALRKAGGLVFNVVDHVPDVLTGGRRPGDDRLTTVTARRPVAEAVVASAADATPGVTVRRGVAVTGVTTGPSTGGGAPHVTGVVADSGEEVPADLVVDATGRRSPIGSWLTAAGGGAPPDEGEESGFVYYGRHFRSEDGSVPALIGPLAQSYGSVGVLTLPADNGTWSVVVVGDARDGALRALRDPQRWAAVVGAMPLAAHWLDGTPIDDGVAVMAKIEDRRRRLVVDGRPVVTGLCCVGDAWACTNPSLGRGVSIGTVQAVALRDTLRHAGPDDPAGLAAAWEDATEATVGPWYEETLSLDRHRLGQVRAAIAGEPYEPGDPVWELGQALQAAAPRDPDVFRAMLEVVSVLRTGGEVLADPALLDKVVALGADWRDGEVLGPDRAGLLALLEP